MTQQNPSAPTHAPNANLGSARDLRALLEATLEALTLPTDTADYDRRINDRVTWARITLVGALEEAPEDIGWNVDFLRGKLVAEQADAEQRAANSCHRCHIAFDPTDMAFDGRARHRDTPFCRRCVDSCHDADAFHECVICRKPQGGEGQ